MYVSPESINNNVNILLAVVNNLFLLLSFWLNNDWTWRHVTKFCKCSDDDAYIKPAAQRLLACGGMRYHPNYVVDKYSPLHTSDGH